MDDIITIEYQSVFSAGPLAEFAQQRNIRGQWNFIKEHKDWATILQMMEYLVVFQIGRDLRQNVGRVEYFLRFLMLATLVWKFFPT